MKTPTATQLEIHRRVCGGQTIADVAKEAGMSKSTIRRWLDIVTEFRCTEFNITLKGDELQQVLGWLRNGNWRACDLADSIEEQIEEKAT
jgi:transposase